jgi:hypothetical protein
MVYFLWAPLHSLSELLPSYRELLWLVSSSLKADFTENSIR